MQTLNFLGRGSAFNTKEGNTSAFLIEKETLILIDCGETVFAKILEENVLAGIKEVNVFITHCHSDHVGSLSSLIHYCYYVLGIKPTIYFPTNAVAALLIQQGNTFYQFNLVSIEEASSTSITITKWGITYSCVPHVDGMNSFAYTLRDIEDDYMIYYSGDCREVDPKASCYLYDEIYHEVCLNASPAHTHFDELLKLNWNRGNVYLMHLDDNKLIGMAEEKGFKVVELY